MLLKPQVSWRKEATIWILCLAATLVFTVPLIVKGTQEIVAPTMRRQEQVWPALASFREASNRTPDLSKPVLGQAYLDLDSLARNYSAGEADNVRWSLRRPRSMAGKVV